MTALCMEARYAVRQLAPRRFRQAYALLQAAGLDVSLDEWMTQARAIAVVSRGWWKLVEAA